MLPRPNGITRLPAVSAALQLRRRRSVSAWLRNSKATPRKVSATTTIASHRPEAFPGLPRRQLPAPGRGDQVRDRRQVEAALSATDENGRVLP